MKFHYSLKVETILHVDGEGRTEHDCLISAKLKAEEIINTGGLIMDMRPVKKTQTEE